MTKYYDVFSGNMPWPHFVRLKKDEILSSWITRLAHSHNMSPLTFCRLALGINYVLDKDIDKGINEEQIRLLAQGTDTPKQVIMDSTFSSFTNNGTDKFSNRWLLPFGEFKGQKKRHSIQYCPSCLRKDGNSPYFRKEWRLSIITECIKCKHELLDECPKCSSSITLIHGGNNRVSIVTCRLCGTDLSQVFSTFSKTKTLEWEAKTLNTTAFKEPAKNQKHLIDVSHKIVQATHTYWYARSFTTELKEKFQLNRCVRRREILQLLLNGI